MLLPYGRKLTLTCLVVIKMQRGFNENVLFVFLWQFNVIRARVSHWMSETVLSRVPPQDNDNRPQLRLHILKDTSEDIFNTVTHTWHICKRQNIQAVRLNGQYVPLVQVCLLLNFFGVVSSSYHVFPFLCVTSATVHTFSTGRRGRPQAGHTAKAQEYLLNVH